MNSEYDLAFLDKLCQLKNSYDAYLNNLFNDEPIVNYNSNTSNYYKNLLANMNPILNIHILEIFTPKMLFYLPMYDIHYYSVAQYIITDKDTDISMEKKIRAIFDHFGNHKIIFPDYPSEMDILQSYYDACIRKPKKRLKKVPKYNSKPKTKEQIEHEKSLHRKRQQRYRNKLKNNQQYSS